MSEVIAAVLVPICLFGLPVVAFIVHRVLKHQERIEMIRHGMAPPSAGNNKEMWDAFARMNASNTAGSQPWVAPARTADPAFGYEIYAAAQSQLRKGLTTGLIGLALFIGLSFIDLGRPGPWLLGGLIPMFVGIAQVLIAMMSGARFTFGPPGPVYQGRPSAPPPEGPQSASPRDVTPGSYAYRPGSTTELEPPPIPPEKRF
ncbi:MAG: hypothetical protein NVS9B12_02090 [Vulcanimicrobiaceae bacterium]